MVLIDSNCAGVRQVYVKTFRGNSDSKYLRPSRSVGAFGTCKRPSRSALIKARGLLNNNLYIHVVRNAKFLRDLVK